jgi:hypothetical protein
MYGMSSENLGLNGDAPVKADLIGANAFSQPAQSCFWGFGARSRIEETKWLERWKIPKAFWHENNKRNSTDALVWSMLLPLANF